MITDMLLQGDERNEKNCNHGYFDGSMINNLPISGSGRSPGGGNGNPLQYSCLEHPREEPGGLQSMG